MHISCEEQKTTTHNNIIIHDQENRSKQNFKIEIKNKNVAWNNHLFIFILLVICVDVVIEYCIVAATSSIIGSAVAQPKYSYSYSFLTQQQQYKILNNIIMINFINNNGIIIQ